ncbi:potassium voltage-gated channel Eag-related subfamily H member 5 [Fistulifera solaris]|jgi:PAS domain S-box-containing protein|uniref:Potassium voltage-gated channel Eag-related subfamily H member 5 n=1 Tax=Fistulifera solaris TaxID=1519565 RepID=A0A1Z5JH60_FISSO|nr:potassium voltage-gated channel Eag-related subfamily H member 5 [Fistulifera solaris]|eukprot:GAX13101.1 potassium voltage-gated channel Eag-related subfamily H member 5 [Fistulifera solaris]
MTAYNRINPPAATGVATSVAAFQKTAYNPAGTTSVPLLHSSGLGDASLGAFNYIVTLPSVTPTTVATNAPATEIFSLLSSQAPTLGMPKIPAPTNMTTLPKATQPKPSKKRSAPVDAFEFLMQQQEQEDDDNEEDVSEEEPEERTPTGRPKKKKSIVQKERRRERNRLLAKKTREKKRGYLETLQMEVLALQRENYKLRDLVKSEVVNSEEILQGCNALESVPQSVLDACKQMEQADPEHLFDMASRIKTSQHAFIITDPSLPDNPIVFASGDFLKLTGYDRSQVLGRNCRFLQGPNTNSAKIETIRTALATGEDMSVTLLNYRADATPFWNQLFIAALRNANSEIVNYMGVIVEVTGPAPGDPEHGKALPRTVVGANATPDIDTAAVG